jgi:hypothetical protein
MDSAEALFDELSAPSSPAEVLERLVSQYRRERRPHELFEALKLRLRCRLGLPLAGEESSALTHAQDQSLEQGLLEICREVGALLLEQGKLREGWMYLRPVGDRDLARRLIQQLPADDERAEDLIQILLYESVDPGRGFQMLLERNGICNSITAFDQALAQRPASDQRPAAEVLLKTVYRELRENLRADIERREGRAPASESLWELIESRPVLTEGGAYHLDTTHLMSTIRIARVLEDPALGRMAWELTRYGERLHPQYHYPGDEPFEEFYRAHRLWFGSLLGIEAEPAIDYFRQRAETADVQASGTAAVECYLELLARLHRWPIALREAERLLPDELPPSQTMQLLWELSRGGGDFTTMQRICQRRGDRLGFAMATAAARQASAVRPAAR